ncbi:MULTISPECIES: EF-hand domain-containing protein [unclassified Novosphingobium]|uniref:EF-hand domain-containing protein n=1 Tax=unclassified Novosphingobium TaxID=2644732 RepID=UPI0025E3141D|nr:MULTISPECIES: EF-hand domain-containing protein [unclassified Novosphingobium]HQS71227.1 EF-hand domain-containing protein [Novosphingobium sp.]
MTKFNIAAAAAVMATASVALYSASPALAQQMDRGAGKTVTWAEAKTKADTMWTKLDVNKDAKIDKGDREAKMAERFAKIDTDKNGSISQAEFMAHHSAMKGAGKGPGKMADGQKDGPREGWKGRGKGRMGHHGMMSGGMGGGMRMLAMADTNKDSMVSRAEYDAGVKMHFDMVDTNKDGKITPEERRAAMKEMRAKMGKMRGPGAMGDGPPPPPPAG